MHTIYCYCNEKIEVTQDYAQEFCEVECPNCGSTIDISHLYEEEEVQ